VRRAGSTVRQQRVGSVRSIVDAQRPPPNAERPLILAHGLLNETRRCSRQTL
jgi:hypothetical protein